MIGNSVNLLEGADSLILANGRNTPTVGNVETITGGAGA
jgi:hypothetical protein